MRIFKRSQKKRELSFCEKTDQTKVAGVVLERQKLYVPTPFFRCKSIPIITTIAEIQAFKKLPSQK